jgi:hypothetical protein
MTEQTDNHDMSATLQITFERLLVGAQAARLAIDIAGNTEQTSSAARVSSREIFRNWRSANLLVQIAFDQFYGHLIDMDFLTRSIRRQD